MVMTFMVLGWMVADVVWWRLADRAVRRARWAGLWRGIVGVFCVAQLAYLVIFLVGMYLDLDWWWPMPLAVGAYLWHLGVVLGTLMAVGVWKGAGWLRRSR